MAGAALFAWLHGADFYRDLHREAVELMGRGFGRSWLDVGTGPGLVALLAAGRGYRVRGVDKDADMIAAANRAVRALRHQLSFETSDLAAEIARGRRYDVVCAASLLVVTPEPGETLTQLISLVEPGGRLLIVEASASMTRLRALRLFLRGRLGVRGYMLLLWALARSGRAFDARILARADMNARRHPLLEGLVDAWILEVRK